MKICVAQTRPFKGDIEKNIASHKKIIGMAVSKNCDMIIFPELSLTGYEPLLAKDLATNIDDTRLNGFQQISDDDKIIIGVGMPLKTDNGTSISMIIFQAGQPRQVYSKKYLHQDEEPFFVSGQSTVDLLGDDNKIALAICYELSIPDHSEEAFKKGAKIYIASVAKTAGGIDKANISLSDIAKKNSMIILLSNCIGPNDDFEGAGRSAVWNSDGLLLKQLNETDEGIIIFDTETQEVLSSYC